MYVPQVAAGKSFEYRPDIDGLRAVAVLSVLAYHYGFLLPGGFTGVDVFFVISGFLITQILAREIETNTFSLLNFYARRIRRIMPALIVMLLACLVVGDWMLLPGDYADTSRSVIASAFALSNFHFLNNTGYFDQTAEMMVLLHTWSLAVEEQFYLIWPPLLYLIVKGRTRLYVTSVVGALVIADFAVSVVWLSNDPKGAFFLPFPRAWELAIGALLVFLPQLPRWLGEVATLAGLGLIGFGFVMVSATDFPGIAALYPCVGAALAIWPRSHSLSGSLLGIASPIGKISYSLYLWHWPVWVFFRVYNNNGTPSLAESLALATASIALAALSWCFVEQPFRRQRWTSTQTIWGGITASCIVLCVGGYVWSWEGIPSRLPSEWYSLRSREAMFAWQCGAMIPGIAPGIEPQCTFGAPWETATSRAVLWGDSNAQHLTPLIEESAKSAGTAVDLYSGCAPYINQNSFFSPIARPPAFNEDCQKTYDDLFKMLDARPDIQTVIMSAVWNVTTMLSPGPAYLAVSGQELFERSLSDTIERLIDMGRRVVVITTIPYWTADPIPCAMIERGLPRRTCLDAQKTLKRENYEMVNAVTLAIFRRIAARLPQITLIEPGASLCREENCTTAINGEFLYFDHGHLRRNFTPKTRSDFARLIGVDRIFAKSE